MAMVNVLEQSAPVEDKATVPAEPQVAPVEEKAPVAAEAPSKQFAGRFNSVEDLEAGYDSLMSQQGRAGQELGDLRAQLTTQGEQMQQLLDAQSTANQAPETDYDAARAGIATQIDDGDMTFAEGLLEIRKVDAMEMAEQNAQSQEQILSQAQQQYQTELQTRDEQQLAKRFHDANPDFAALQQSGELQKILEGNEFLSDDYQAYLQYQASQAFDKGKSEAANEISGSAPAGNVASSPGSAIKTETPANAGRSATKSELLQSGLAAWNNAAGG